MKQVRFLFQGWPLELIFWYWGIDKSFLNNLEKTCGFSVLCDFLKNFSREALCRFFVYKPPFFVVPKGSYLLVNSALRNSIYFFRKYQYRILVISTVKKSLFFTLKSPPIGIFQL